MALYIGVTANLTRRVYEHRESVIEGLTKKYGLKLLIYFEVYQDITPAIQREKQLKHWGRQKKTDLIKHSNPQWQDLWGEIVGFYA